MAPGVFMSIEAVVKELDKQIERMQKAKQLLLTDAEEDGYAVPLVTRKKYKISAASRKKMADAQKKRWAKRKAAVTKA